MTAEKFYIICALQVKNPGPEEQALVIPRGDLLY